MRVTVVLEHRFQSLGDGPVWTDGPFPYSFFQRYLKVFDGVRVVARIERIESSNGSSDASSRRYALQRSDGPGVEFHAVPAYVGPWRYLLRRGELLRAADDAMAQAVDAEAAVILRIPSQVALLAFEALSRRAWPFGAEVVGDPMDALAPGANLHPLRALFRAQQTAALEKLCRAASATAYVTEQALQRRYPPGKGKFTTHYSSVELGDDAFVAGPPRPRMPFERLISVGSMEHCQKGQDTLIEALARCNRRGLRLSLTLVGAGRMQPWFEQQAKKHGVIDQVVFRGRLASGAAVRKELDSADLFVLPSRQEGLPRALLEAMARGLPCIASTVGGVPEALDPAWLVAPNDGQETARLICEFAERPQSRAAQAARNLDRAREFHNDRLEPRRVRFYREVTELRPVRA